VAAFVSTRLTCPAGRAGATKPNPADNPENENTKEQKGTEKNTKERLNSLPSPTFVFGLTGPQNPA
jgi:hypothetical protein